MKKISKMAACFLLTFGLVGNSFADDVFSIYTYPPFDFNDEEFVAGKVDFTPVGTVSIWTQKEIPKSWLECDGSTVDKNKYPELYKMMKILPDYRGRFLQGSDDINKIGDRLEAGLPNIRGYMVGTSTYGNYFVNYHVAQGAFTREGPTYWTHADVYNQGYLSGSQGLGFNASLSSPIYGNSTTVYTAPY